jgi:hypothetical protein
MMMDGLKGGTKWNKHCFLQIIDNVSTCDSYFFLNKMHLTNRLVFNPKAYSYIIHFSLLNHA